MTAWIYPQSKAYLAQERWAQRHWSGGVGVVLTIAIHVLVIALLLAGRGSMPSHAVPMNVTVISATPQPSQQLAAPTKPRLDRPMLHIPTPEIAFADEVVSSRVPVVIASAAPNNAVPSAPMQTQPNFDAAYLNNPAPNYPPLARRMREEGVVYVRVFVTSAGLPEQIELKRSSGSARLDEAALTTVKKWRFVPAQRGNQTIGAWVVVPIAFSLTA